MEGDQAAPEGYATPILPPDAVSRNSNFSSRGGRSDRSDQNSQDRFDEPDQKLSGLARRPGASASFAKPGGCTGEQPVISRMDQPSAPMQGRFFPAQTRFPVLVPAWAPTRMTETTTYQDMVIDA